MPDALAACAYLGWVRRDGGAWEAVAGAAGYRECWARLERAAGGRGMLLVVPNGVLP